MNQRKVISGKTGLDSPAAGATIIKINTTGRGTCDYPCVGCHKRYQKIKRESLERINIILGYDLPVL